MAKKHKAEPDSATWLESFHIEAICQQKERSFLKKYMWSFRTGKHYKSFGLIKIIKARWYNYRPMLI